ncbi:hypothetical protein P5F25_15085 [Clostridium perfringens]|nr:hypothetical protein [Clostridium perfringens]HAT4069847.1 hypothetical protein [Clostridium perfringens]HAT4097395.1 hypothetical protein [Clostridium perfringens]
MTFKETIIITIFTIAVTTLVNIILYFIREKYINESNRFVDLKEKTVEVLVKNKKIITNPYIREELDESQYKSENLYRVKLDILDLIGKWKAFASRGKNKIIFRNKYKVANEVANEFICLSDRLVNDDYNVDNQGVSSQEKLEKMNLKYIDKIMQKLNIELDLKKED